MAQSDAHSGHVATELTRAPDSPLQFQPGAAAAIGDIRSARGEVPGHCRLGRLRYPHPPRERDRAGRARRTRGCRGGTVAPAGSSAETPRSRRHRALHAHLGLELRHDRGRCRSIPPRYRRRRRPDGPRWSGGPRHFNTCDGVGRPHEPRRPPGRLRRGARRTWAKGPRRPGAGPGDHHHQEGRRGCAADWLCPSIYGGTGPHRPTRCPGRSASAPSGPTSARV